MNVLRIKDNSLAGREAFEPLPKLTHKLANKTLGQLANEGVFVFPKSVEDTEDITSDQRVIQQANETYRTGNVVGFLGLENEQLIITSRFSADDTDYFFQYMLRKVFNIPNILELETNANQENRLYDLLFFMLPYYLNLNPLNSFRGEVH